MKVNFVLGQKFILNVVCTLFWLRGIVAMNAHVDHHHKHVKMRSLTLWIVSEL